MAETSTEHCASTVCRIATKLWRPPLADQGQGVYFGKRAPLALAARLVRTCARPCCCPHAWTFADSVERRITAIQAIRDAEIEHLLTQLRLLRSYFSKEQLETPALQFFAENLPSLSVVKNEEDGQFELEWKSKDKDNNPPISYDDERNGCASLMQRTSIGYPDCSDAFPAISGFQFSSEAVKTNFLEAASLHTQDFGLEELSQTQMLGFQDAFQTPGVNSQRLSVGVTPKTLRLPKNGEMLLSVRGSPLGVYREEDNMEAIHESEEG